MTKSRRPRTRILSFPDCDLAKILLKVFEIQILNIGYQIISHYEVKVSQIRCSSNFVYQSYCNVDNLPPSFCQSVNPFAAPQVSTRTGIITRKVFLDVVSPVAFILGGDEYHIDRGSHIALVCVIEKAPTPPQ